MKRKVFARKLSCIMAFAMAATLIPAPLTAVPVMAEEILVDDADEDLLALPDEVYEEDALIDTSANEETEAPSVDDAAELSESPDSNDEIFTELLPDNANASELIQDETTPDEKPEADADEKDETSEFTPDQATDEDRIKENGHEPIYSKDGLSVYGDIYNNEYDGTAKKFNWIYVYKNGNRLWEKTDFTVSYKDNVNAGTAKLILKPAGNFAGQAVEIPFTIRQYDLSPQLQEYTYTNEDGEEVTTSYNYIPFRYDDTKLRTIENGQAQKPDPGVKVQKYVKTSWTYVSIKAGTKGGKGDYYLEYPDTEEGAYVKPGDWRILVKGMGNYTGSAELFLTIYSKENMAPLSRTKVQPEKSTYTYDEVVDASTGQYKELTVKITDGNKVLDPSQYNVYWYDLKVGKSTIIIEGTGATTKDNPIGYQGLKFATVNVTGTKITSKNTQVEWPKKEYYYEDSSWTNDFTVKVNGKELTYGNQYTYGSTYNKNIGKLTIIGYDGGGYTGSVTVTKELKAHELSDFDFYIMTPKIGGDDYFNYGPSAKDEITASNAKNGAKPLICSVSLTAESGYKFYIYKNTDFTVKYKDFKTPGKATIEITGKGIYKGKTLSIPYTVVTGDMGKVKATAPDVAYSVKMGKKWMSKPVLIDEYGSKLKEGTDYYKLTDADYNCDYTKALTLGAIQEVPVTITITGKGIYEGTKTTCTYRIINPSYDISKATFTIKDKAYNKQGVYLSADDFTSALAPDKSTNLEFGKDFEIVEYKNNRKKGTAQVTLKGIGTYGGTKTVKFKIAADKL